MARFFQNIELTRTDALALRELVRPFDGNLPDFAKGALYTLSMKIYAALIELEREGVDSCNVTVDEHECLLINQKVGNEDWEGALPLLRQTWAVLWEWKHDMPPGTSHTIDEILRGVAVKEEVVDGSSETNRV